MKVLKYSFSMLLAVAIVALTASCRDESLNPVPAWETAVNGYAELIASNNAFSTTDVAKPVQYKFRWVSIDNANTVTKIEYYVALNEAFVDKDGNDRTARHGDKLWKVVEGSGIAANRAFMNESITQAGIYNLFKGAKYNYGNGSVDVFTSNGRTVDKPLIKADEVNIRWELTTADGRKFFEWSPGICGETPGTNCNIAVAVK